MRRVFLVFLLILAIAKSSGFFVQDSEWDNYKAKFGKTYRDLFEETFSRLCYGFNKFEIQNHNDRYKRGIESYRVEVNQFSDLKFVNFVGMFPPTTDIQSNAVPFTVLNTPPQSSFSYTAQGFTSPVQNQGIVCNGGWAYATATTIQIFYASISGNLNSELLSAQNLIDCAGEATSCSKQVPQTAFDYLTKMNQKLYPESEYRNNPTRTQGMCVLPVASTAGKTLRSYSSIEDGNDDMLKSAVNFFAPVVIKINPANFGFMHYKEGLYTQPRPTRNAALYVTVVGYGIDEKTKKNYWLVQNSFGSTWGEAGMMRIEMNSAKPIARSGVFPSE
ncbi:uncharacterized protein LOC129919089 [Episyrphus balteatus]|uniref:uncharacterized protein LOC129919089 n=1 Tax=Episyrphus balteatus TaxID=286459 RepID=UPI002484F87E|nr:uncharacterized protein LOC129919089 [Episyrphus balteatus]